MKMKDMEKALKGFKKKLIKISNVSPRISRIQDMRIFHTLLLM